MRVLLAEKGIDVHLRLEKEWERRPAFLHLNPAGEVPVVVMDDGLVLAGVLASAEYLEEAYPEPSLLPGNAENRTEIRRLVGWFHTKFGAEVSRILVRERLLKRHFGMGEVDSTALRAMAHNLKIHLKYIAHLTAEQSYLAGSQFTMADAAAAAHLSVADYFGVVIWEDYPGVKEWYSRVKCRRSMRALLTDRIGGITPPPHYADVEF